MLGNPASGPSPKPTSGTEAAKRDMAASTRADMLQASATNLNLNDDKEKVTSGTKIPEDRRETALAGKIKELWSSQKMKGASLRRRRVELDTLRNSLAERLQTYKDLLARTGRGGKWTEFLRQANISRTMADRYVENGSFQRTQSPKNAPVVRLRTLKGRDRSHGEKAEAEARSRSDDAGLHCAVHDRTRSRPSAVYISSVMQASC